MLLKCWRASCNFFSKQLLSLPLLDCVQLEPSLPVYPMSDPAYNVPINTRLLRATIRPIFRVLFNLLGRVRITGLENVPPSGAYVIAFNHISTFDGPFVVTFWPHPPEVAVAVDVWSRRGQSILVQLYGCIPVHRGHFDRKLIDTTSYVLKSGYPLAIAPEGGRSHNPGMRRALPGVAYIIDLARVPVIPVGVIGATDDFFKRGLRGERPTIGMRVGKALHLPPLKGKGATRRAARQTNADLIMRQIANLLPSEYHGVYTGAKKTQD